MDSTGGLSPTGRFVLGGLMLAFGSVVMLAAVDIGPLAREDVNGPPWLAVAAGGVFAAAGIAVMAGERLPVLAEFMGLTILIGLAAIGKWIAFGAGARACSGSLSLGVLGAQGGMSGLGCRIPFGLGAIVIDGVIAWLAVSMLQSALGGPPALARVKSVANTVLMVCVSPLLFVVLLAVVVPVAVKVVHTRLTTGQWPRNESFIRRQREKLRRGIKAVDRKP
jgi:hypothetical protein